MSVGDEVQFVVACDRLQLHRHIGTIVNVIGDCYFVISNQDGEEYVRYDYQLVLVRELRC